MLNLNLNTTMTLVGGPAVGPTPPPIPVVDFVADNTNPGPSGAVQFTDLSTNAPNSWLWSFPGGTPSSSTSQNPKIIYGATGTYDVTLQAGNTGGTGSLTKPNYINVEVPWVLKTGIWANGSSVWTADGIWNTYCSDPLVSETSLWAYYKFDAGGTGLTYDESVNSFTLTNNGVGATAGLFSGGAEFDGTGYMTGSTDLGLEPYNGSTGWTFATWVSLDNLVNAQTIYSKRRTTPSPQGTRVQLRPSLGDILVTMTAVNMSFTYPVDKFTDNSWHHVAVTWDGSVVEVYVDRESIGTAARSTYNNATSLALNIGREMVGDTSYLQGKLDEYIIYRNRDIGAADISTLGAGSCPLTPPE